MLTVSTALGRLVVSRGPLCVTAIAWTGSLKTTNTQTHCIDKAAFAYHSCWQHYLWLRTRLFKRWSLVCVQATPQSLWPNTLSRGLDIDLDDWEPEDSTCRIMVAKKKLIQLLLMEEINGWTFNLWGTDWSHTVQRFRRPLANTGHSAMACQASRLSSQDSVH